MYRHVQALSSVPRCKLLRASGQIYLQALNTLWFQVLGWATQIDDRMSKLKQIVRQYNERDGIVIKLQDAIKRQSGVAPVGANAAADEWDPSVSFKVCRAHWCTYPFKPSHSPSLCKFCFPLDTFCLALSIILTHL